LHFWILILIWLFYFLTQVFYKANDGKKFKQTNVLQKLLKILLMLCALKRFWSKHLQPEIISQNK
jgi:hypothetical protein